MITKICPGDLYVYLDNDGYEYPTLSTHTMSEGKNFRILSTESGWTFHPMNRANPIPGRYCEVCTTDYTDKTKCVLLSGNSEEFDWNEVTYYRVGTLYKQEPILKKTPITWFVEGDIRAGDLYRTFSLGGSHKVGIADHDDYSMYDDVKLLAKGPGWVEHDGSVVCPVPGTMTQVYSGDYVLDPVSSENWNWEFVKFYKVTANYNQDVTVEKKMVPKVGYTTTVEFTVTEVDEDSNGGIRVWVKWPDGDDQHLLNSTVESLEWKAPPPVLEVGKKAKNRSSGEVVTISAIGTIKVLAVDKYGWELSWCKSNMIPLGDDEQ
jgi:hypothetical protein